MRFAFPVCVLLLGVTSAAAQTPLGTKPGFTSRTLTPKPNAEAINRAIWLPGIDEGYVPQGVTFLDGRLYVSSYRSTDPQRSRGPCRLFSVDPETGATLSFLDLPAQCGHAGGIARGPSGTIFVADTRHLFEVTLTKGSPRELGRITRIIALYGEVKGSFAASTADAIWLGAYEREGAPKLFAIPWQALRAARITEKDASEAIALPLRAQGAAFAPNGELWVTRSGSKFGELLRLDRKSGKPVARFAMPIGLEDISFEPGGALWSLSEAGSQRWNSWDAFHPLAFRVDVERLK